MYEGIIISAFITVKAKAPKLFQVLEELLKLHVYYWQHYLFTALWWVICIPEITDAGNSV
jgi:hypothetical protein